MAITHDQFAAHTHSVDNNSNLKKPITAVRKYRAKVVDTEDPLKLGRVKVWIVDSMEGFVEDNKGLWAMPGNNCFVGNRDSELVGRDDLGSLFIPPKETYVYVTFEDGDFNKPFYHVGLNLSTNETVPIENQYGKKWWDKWTLIKTPQGRQILVSDDDTNDESVIIRGKYLARGKRAFLGDPRYPYNSMYFQIWEKSGEEYILIKDTKNQWIKLDTANTCIRIQHPTGSYIELSDSGDIIIQAAKNVYINCYSPTPNKPAYGGRQG